MATQWSKWFLIFVEAKKVDTANLLALQWDPEGGAGTFTVPMSATGQDPPTHYATSTAATATMRDGITTALGVLSWAHLYWTDDVYHDEGGEGAHWTGPDGWTHDGDMWSAWVASREDMGGLSVIQPEDIFAVRLVERVKSKLAQWLWFILAALFLAGGAVLGTITTLATAGIVLTALGFICVVIGLARWRAANGKHR